MVEEEVQLRFCCLLSCKTNRGNTGRTVLRHRLIYRTLSNATLADATLVLWILNSILFSVVGAPAKNELHSH